MNSKKIFFRLTAALSLFLSACAPKGEWLTDPPRQEPETNLRFDINGGKGYLCTENSVYFSVWANDYDGALLMCYDTDSHTLSAICEKEDCLHIDRDCGAWLGRGYANLYRDPASGDIYIYNFTNSISNDLFGVYSLEKITGNHREVIGTIGDGAADGRLLFGDKGIYMLIGRRNEDNYRLEQSILLLDYEGNFLPGPAVSETENSMVGFPGGEKDTRFIVVSHIGEGVNDDIYTIDINTGLQTPVYNILFPPANIGIEIIDYGPDGLYIAVPEGDGRKGGIFKIYPDGSVNVVAQGVRYTNKTWNMYFLDEYIILEEYMSNLNTPADIQLINTYDGSVRNISAKRDGMAYEYLGATKDYILVNYYARPGHMEYGLIPKTDWLAGEGHIEITIK